MPRPKLSNKFPEVIELRARTLLAIWAKQIKELKPRVKELRKRCEDPELQFDWDSWKESEQRLSTLQGCYESLKAVLKR